MVRNARKLFSNQNNSSNISHEDLEELSSDYDFFNKDDIRELDKNINNINHRFDIASGDSQEVKQIMDAINSLEGYVKLINNSIYQNGHCDVNVIKSIQIGTEALSNIIGIEPEDVVLTIESLDFIDNEVILTNEIKDKLSDFVKILHERLDYIFNKKIRGLKNDLIDNKESTSLGRHVSNLNYIVKKFQSRANSLKNDIQESMINGSMSVPLTVPKNEKLNLFKMNGVIYNDVLDPVRVIDAVEKLTHNVLLNGDSNIWMKDYNETLNEVEKLINKIDLNKKGEEGIKQFFCILNELKDLVNKPIPYSQDNKSDSVNTHLINNYFGVSVKFNTLSVCNEPLMSFYQSPQPVSYNAVDQLKKFIYIDKSIERYKSLIEYIDRFNELLDFISTFGTLDNWKKASQIFPIFDDYSNIILNEARGNYNNSDLMQESLQKAIKLSVLTGDLDCIVNNLKFLISTKISNSFKNENSEQTLGEYFSNLFDQYTPEKDLTTNNFICYPFVWFLELTKTSGKFNTDMGEIYSDVTISRGDILNKLYNQYNEYNMNKLKFLFKNWELSAINNSMQAYNNLIYYFCNSFINFVISGINSN